MNPFGLPLGAFGFGRRLAACLKIDFVVVVELAFWRISLPVLKRVVGLNALTRMMWSENGTGIDPVQRELRMHRVNRILSMAGRMLISSNCLERSLVLYRLFSRAGAEPVLVLGTAADQTSLDGHVWVELDGVAVGEPNRARYTSVVSFTRQGRACPSTGLGAHA